MRYKADIKGDPICKTCLGKGFVYVYDSHSKRKRTVCGCATVSNINVQIKEIRIDGERRKREDHTR